MAKMAGKGRSKHGKALGNRALEMTAPRERNGCTPLMGTKAWLPSAKERCLTTVAGGDQSRKEQDAG